MSFRLDRIRFLQLSLMLAASSFSVIASPQAARADDAPNITFFGAGHLFGDWWHLYGTIDDESPDMCEIYFSGLLDGYSVDVSSNGEFSLVLEIPFGQSGLVGATALDVEYQWSDTAWDYIYNY